MQLRRLRLNIRRKLKRSQKQAEVFSTQAEQNIDRHIFKRFGRLTDVRRFVISWLVLMLIIIGLLVAQTIALSDQYQAVEPVPGGIYNEGVLGTFTNSSPIYATSNVDASVSRLVFSGLLKYDQNNQLVPDLAESYSVSASGLTYTVRLKPNLTWHDGQPLTSADVVYTYQTIQNPDAQSPLQSSWQGITITATDAQTVTIKLPNALAAFPYNLTTGIVPQHILGKTEPADLRSSDFNTIKPVGAGPFSWQAIEANGDDLDAIQQQIALKPFDKYALGKPKLNEFTVQAYANKDQLIDAFTDGKLTGVSGLNEVPKQIKDMSSANIMNIPLNAANMVFFKTTAGVLSDRQVRQALVQSADVDKIVDQLDYPARLVRSPILIGQVAYDHKFVQAGFDLQQAKQKLTSAGWIEGKNGLRTKNGQPLQFSLTISDNTENRMVAKQLQAQWRAVGADVKIDIQKQSDFQNTVADHSYDALLYGISIGSDPDVYVYWNSSQADIRSGNRLNFSEFKNSNADTALESGRTRRDPAIRAVKYRPFLQAWQQEAPAVGLFQPRMLYITNGPVFGLTDHSINNPIGRFNNVENWQIRLAKVTN